MPVDTAVRGRGHVCSCHSARHLAPLVAGRPVTSLLPATPATSSRRAQPRLADLVVVGNIRTMNAAEPRAEAMAVSDGRIVAVGDRADIENVSGPDTELLELGEGYAYPGLIDPHMHYWASAMLEGWVDCSPLHGASFDEIVGRLKLAGPSQGEWTLGAKYDPSLIAGEPELTRAVLDAAIPDRPVLVMNASLHYAYLNSRGLELAGITEDSPDPPGGKFIRAGGRLTGALGELPAIGRALVAVPQKTQEQFLDGVIAISQRAARQGITRTHDAATGMVLGASEPSLIHSVSERLATRVSYAIYDAVAEKLIDEGFQAGTGDDMVRAVSWKLISDGSNQGRSGYQLDPYLGLDFNGEPNFDADYVAERVALAHEHGWQVMVHANGDAAIAMVIDGYRQGLNGTSGLEHRDRIEHCSFPHDDDLAQMAELGLSPSFLMNHVYYWGRAFADNIVGVEKAGRLDPVASALRHGLRASFHSDYTVTDIDPLRCVQTAVTRRVRDGGAVLNGQERVSAHDAMRAVTIDAAWQVHADHSSGSLETGKHADVVVFGADPLDVDPDGIADIPVVQTLLGGRVTHQA